MKRKFLTVGAAAAAGLMLLTAVPARGATNTATDPGGGGVTLTASGLVTVNSSALLLVKQVWNGAGTLCLASQPADASCSGSATTVTVPAGAPLQFLIFVKNSSDVVLSDVRFQDILDTSGSGFSYTAGSIKRSAVDASAPLDTDTSAAIHTAANTGTAQTDTVDPAVDYASYSSGTLTVGAVTGQANMSLSFPAHKSFAVIFNVTKK